MNDIKTVRDLVRLHRTDFLKLRSTGKKTCKEIDEFLLDHDLRWGMDV
jgi:DNA-directed RNA polymerase alpha subunit